jgi:hypothetical protein
LRGSLGVEEDLSMTRGWHFSTKLREEKEVLLLVIVVQGMEDSALLPA